MTDEQELDAFLQDHDILIVKKEPPWSVAIAWGVSLLGLIVAGICLVGLLSGCQKLDIPSIQSTEVPNR